MWHWATTLTLDFQGQILKQPYSRNGRTDWHGMEEMWVNRVLDPLCNLALWPWLWICKVKFWKSHNPWSGVADWHGMKGMWVTRKSNQLCDFKLWLYLLWDLELFSWPWISRSNCEIVASQEWESHWHGITGMWVDRLLETHYVTLTCNLVHELGFEFLRLNFQIAIS